MAKGIYVGRFDENQCRNHEDRKAVEEAKAKYGKRYTNSKLIKKGGKIIGLDVWVCDLNECEDFF